jgi:transcriptional regulator with XRE-family HTH domain
MTRLRDSLQWFDFLNCGDGFAQILGRNVRAARKRLGMSQEQLALDTDMKRSYVSDMERGTRNPSVKAIGRLAIALGIKPAELLKPLDED